MHPASYSDHYIAGYHFTIISSPKDIGLKLWRFPADLLEYILSVDRFAF